MRKSIRPLIALTAALALTVTAGMSALAQADNNEKHFSVIEAASNEDSLTIPEIAKKCGTSVVAIETETKVVYNTYDNDYYNPFGGMFGYGFGYGYGNRGGRGGTQEYTQKAAGSGVIISEDGYVLTNNHVISGADKITVYVNPGDGSEEKTYEATLIGSSESNDIAVLKIDATGLNAATFGDSNQLEVGELAVAIGNPMGQVHGSVTAGIISAVEQELTIDDVTINAIQTDAAINPGNSGGPLFDLRGNVVGVTTAKYSGETVTGATIEGIGFAIPINDVREILSELREYGRVPNRAQLGVMVGTVYSTNTARNGRVQVRDVTEDSAGAHAGLRDGDFILALDDYTVRTLSDLSAALRHYRGGQHATLTIERYGKTFRLPIVFDSKDDAVQNEEPTTSTNALEPSEQDSPRP